jgi:hypothetical protein
LFGSYPSHGDGKEAKKDEADGMEWNACWHDTSEWHHSTRSYQQPLVYSINLFPSKTIKKERSDPLYFVSFKKVMLNPHENPGLPITHV